MVQTAQPSVERDDPLLALRPLSPPDEVEAIAAHNELLANNFTFLLHWSPQLDWLAYLEHLEQVRQGLDLPDTLVPATFLVMEVAGQLVGRVDIRHRLNDFLAQWGGHIGYAVRPHFWGKGYASEALRQSLVIAANLGVNRALVTCDLDNGASARVIEHCGGIFEGTAPAQGSNQPKRMYWVATS